MNLWTFLLLVACVGANASPVAAQNENPDQSEDDEEPFQYDEDTTDSVDTTLGLFIGDGCEEKCSDDLIHSFCNKASNTCQCDSAHPIVLNKHSCLPPLSLGDLCNHVESCSYSEPNAICAEVSQYYYKCACKAEYQIIATSDGSKCTIMEKEDLFPAELPTALGIGVGLGLFAALLCLVLRLFSNARFGEPRGHYAYAGPPTISLTNASTSFTGPRRSSGPDSNPTSRRQSYAMLTPSNKPGSRRPSTGSIRSQSSVRSMSRSHDQLRPTLSAPTASVIPTPTQTVSIMRSPRRIPIFTNVVVEENDTIEDSPEIQVIPLKQSQSHLKI